MVSEINANWNQHFRCWGELLKFSMMWSKERTKKALKYSSKWAILAAWLFLFSKGSWGEFIAAVKKLKFHWAGTSREIKSVVRCKWIKKMAERWRWVGEAAPPFCPQTPVSCFNRQSWLNVQVKWCLGTMLVFCGGSCPLSCRKSPGSVYIYWRFHTRQCWGGWRLSFNMQLKG